MKRSRLILAFLLLFLTYGSNGQRPQGDGEEIGSLKIALLILILILLVAILILILCWGCYLMRLVTRKVYYGSNIVQNKAGSTRKVGTEVEVRRPTSWKSWTLQRDAKDDDTLDVKVKKYETTETKHVRTFQREAETDQQNSSQQPPKTSQKKINLKSLSWFRSQNPPNDEEMQAQTLDPNMSAPVTATTSTTITETKSWPRSIKILGKFHATKHLKEDEIPQTEAENSKMEAARVKEEKRRLKEEEKLQKSQEEWERKQRLKEEEQRHIMEKAERKRAAEAERKRVLEAEWLEIQEKKKLKAQKKLEAKQKAEALEKEKRQKESAEKLQRDKEAAEEAKRNTEAREQAKREKLAQKENKRQKELAEKMSSMERAQKEKDEHEKMKREKETLEKERKAKEKEAAEKARAEKEAAQKAKKEAEIQERKRLQLEKEALEKARREKEAAEKAQKEEQSLQKAAQNAEVATKNEAPIEARKEAQVHAKTEILEKALAKSKEEKTKFELAGKKTERIRTVEEHRVIAEDPMMTVGVTPENLAVRTTIRTTTTVITKRKPGTDSEIILAELADGEPPLPDLFDSLHVQKKDGEYIPAPPDEDLTVEQIKPYTLTSVTDVELRNGNK